MDAFKITVEHKTIVFTKKSNYVDIEIIEDGIRQEQIWFFDKDNIELVKFLLSSITSIT